MQEGMKNMGYLGGIPFSLRISGEGNTVISFQPMDYAGVCPEALKGAAKISLTDGKTQALINEENACELKEEDAQKMAEEFLAELGLSNQIYLEASYALVWDAYMEEVDENLFCDARRVTDGYAFYYGQEEESITGFRTDTGIIVDVNNSGVFAVDIVNSYEIVSVTENVPLLPLESIQEIMRNEMTENADIYFWNTDNTSYTYYTMELLYYRVPDHSREGYCSFVPVWKVEGYSSSVYNAVIVNAIDGGIIDEWDQEA